MISPHFRYALVFYSVETRLLLRVGLIFYDLRTFKFQLQPFLKIEKRLPNQ